MIDKTAKIVVAGGSGLVGTNLIDWLLSAGFTNIIATHNSNFPTRFDMENGYVDWLKVDLTKRIDCDRIVQGAKYLIILAASTSGAATINKNPLIHVTPNILMNAQLLEAAHLAGVEKVVWLSSTTGYPEIDGETFEEDMMAGDPHDKYFAVGWMKRYTEVLMRLYSEKLKDSHMTCVVLRPTNIYGPHDKFDPEVSHVLPALIKKVVDGMNPVEVWGDGKDVRDLVYVDDMVAAILLALEKCDTFDTFNIGCGKGYTVDQILDIIKNITEKENVPTVYNADKPTTIKSRLVNIDKAKHNLGFEPKVSIEDGIRRTIEWYKKNEMD
jgi:GDP-L-fucose synthase